MALMFFKGIGKAGATAMLGALAGLMLASLQIGCTIKPQQVLCTLSKDSIPVFNFRELTESARLARDAYRDSASNVATYGGKYHVEVFPLPKSCGQVLFLKDTVSHLQIISIR